MLAYKFLAIIVRTFPVHFDKHLIEWVRRRRFRGSHELQRVEMGGCDRGLLSERIVIPFWCVFACVCVSFKLINLIAELIRPHVIVSVSCFTVPGLPRTLVTLP